MTDFTLNAQERSDLGKGASRRLRRNANLVPAVIYGGEAVPQSISILAKDLAKMLENEIAFSNIIKLNVDGKGQDVVIKALQRHPAKGFVLHADFQRVVAGQKLIATVPVHLVNQESSIGVKQQGGEIYLNLPDAEVTCLPQDLPDFIEVDIAQMEVGQVLHMSDLKLPKGVAFVALQHGSDLPVVNIHAPRVSKEDASKEEGAAE
ncbi:50S ribosomal protein L25/general stress protein Ctc [Stutzerimonas degradans]|uniref:50S ribosomal protein L25/general stress protein Ctc n=1 Tax=Stutzerimonas degradans TaxID=2968968 RepID=UPI0013F4EBBA|nr:50S ribosomal protein L25/general stress protein Ctc [Stutzerimonas degradans]NHC11827.1 50S ribosomal protein L25/general stress protein Ctc [Stutzerimonas degradans]